MFCEEESHITSTPTRRCGLAKTSFMAEANVNEMEVSGETFFSQGGAANTQNSKTICHLY